jgi:hypothetical protein
VTPKCFTTLLHHHDFKTVVARLWFLSEGVNNLQGYVCGTFTPTHAHAYKCVCMCAHKLATTRSYGQKSIPYLQYLFSYFSEHKQQD